jgi:uncharacterized protein
MAADSITTTREGTEMYKIIGKDGQEYGPANADEMRRWLAENRSNAQTLVQAEGSPDWKPLSAFAEFAADLHTPSPMTPGQPPEASPALPASESLARTWNMLCHLSALAGYIIPFGNILGPLLVWQIKKDEIPSVIEHGKASLNFQLTVLIAVLAGGALAFALSFVCIGFLFIPAVVIIGICGVVFAIIAGIKANNGESYRYPWSLTLVS